MTWIEAEGDEDSLEQVTKNSHDDSLLDDIQSKEAEGGNIK